MSLAMTNRRRRMEYAFFVDGAAAAAAFAPTDVANLGLWLKADGTLWQDSARTTPATADGDPLGAADDYSGGAFHALQATGASRPTLKLNIRNGLPAMRLDGVDDELLSGLTAGAGSYTLFAAFNETAAGDGAGRTVIASQGGATFRFNQHSGNNPANVAWYDGAWKEPAAVAAGWQILEWYLPGGGTGEVVRDGASVGTAAYTASALTTGTVVFGFGGAGVAKGDYGELLLYLRALTAGERTSVRSYLSGRWS
jgi:hypothetical protein